MAFVHCSWIVPGNLNLRFFAQDENSKILENKRKFPICVCAVVCFRHHHVERNSNSPSNSAWWHPKWEFHSSVSCSIVPMTKGKTTNRVARLALPKFSLFLVLTVRRGEGKLKEIEKRKSCCEEIFPNT